MFVRLLKEETKQRFHAMSVRRGLSQGAVARGWSRSRLLMVQTESGERIRVGFVRNLRVRQARSLAKPSTVEMYPAELMAAYRALTSKALTGTLSATERDRYEQVRQEINRHDERMDVNREWDARMAALTERLDVIEKIVDSLPERKK